MPIPPAIELDGIFTRTVLLRLLTHIAGKILQGTRCVVVLWIRIGFNAGPDPAYQVNADREPDPGI